MNAERIRKELLKEKWKGRTSRILSNPALIKKLIQNAGKMTSKKGLKDVKDNISLMTDFLKDASSGEYKKYDKKSLAWVCGALVYVVTPIDLIPDFILLGGWIDDVAIIMYALDQSFLELEKYKVWKQKQQENEKKRNTII